PIGGRRRPMTTRAKAKRAKLDGYTRAKLAAQKKLPVGRRVTYDGIVSKFKGKTGVVAEHEGRGGVVVRFGDETAVVSPFNFVDAKRSAVPSRKGGRR